LEPPVPQVGNYPSPLLCFIGEFLRDVCAHASTPFTVHVVCYELCRVLFSMTNIALQYVWDGVNVYFRTQTVWLLYNVNNRSKQYNDQSVKVRVQLSKLILFKHQ